MPFIPKITGTREGVSVGFIPWSFIIIAVIILVAVLKYANIF